MADVTITIQAGEETPLAFVVDEALVPRVMAYMGEAVGLAARQLAEQAGMAEILAAGEAAREKATMREVSETAEVRR